MRPSFRGFRVVLALAGLITFSTAALTTRASAFHCEQDKCDSLTCVDSGTEQLNCSITPGGSCVTSKCNQE